MLNQVRFIEVDDNHAGQRLDNFLFTLMKGVPKTYVYRVIRKGEVRVNKKRAKQTTRLNVGDMVRIPPVRTAQQNRLVNVENYAFLKNRIIFEDDVMLALNKPAGMAVHAGSGIQTGIIEALRAIFPEQRYLELVHRLDRQTSGCLLLAKKGSALRKLTEDFRQNSTRNPRLDKRYLTLLQGRWTAGRQQINKALNTQTRKNGERMVVVDEQGSYASSIFQPVSTNSKASLLQVKLLTGRTHQVRVHAADQGFPVAGDDRYGDSLFNKQCKEAGLKRMFLHAASLRFYHPVTDQQIDIDAPLPDELTAILSKWGLQQP